MAYEEKDMEKLAMLAYGDQKRVNELVLQYRLTKIEQSKPPEAR
jgi:hypothetical protein